MTNDPQPLAAAYAAKSVLLMKAKLPILFCLLLEHLLAGTALAGGALAFRFGAWSPRGESPFWANHIDTFNIEVHDFTFLAGGVELALDLNRFLQLSVGVDGYNRDVRSNYRDFVREDGTDIEQDLNLTIIPMTAGVRVLPAGKFHRLVPYVGGGFGVYYFNYREKGEFIRFETFDIFADEFRDRGLTAGPYASLGLEFALTDLEAGEEGFAVFAEFRRHWAQVELGGDFAGLGELDLAANQFALGVSLRF